MVVRGTEKCTPYKDLGETILGSEKVHRHLQEALLEGVKWLVGGYSLGMIDLCNW